MQGKTIPLIDPDVPDTLDYLKQTGIYDIHQPLWLHLVRGTMYR